MSCIIKQEKKQSVVISFRLDKNKAIELQKKLSKSKAYENKRNKISSYVKDLLYSEKTVANVLALQKKVIDLKKEFETIVPLMNDLKQTIKKGKTQ